MKFLRTAALTVSTLLVWVGVDQYFLCPRFLTEVPQPFKGEQFYNPYEEIDSNMWLMANLHAHGNAWMGLTNGKGSSADIHQAYTSRGYDISLVSNYHRVDFPGSSDPGFIPVYEHGYNIQKAHYLVIGNTSIHWADYLLPQLACNKQHTINELNCDECIVVINHPGLRDAFSKSDMAQLSGYQYMEVASPYSNAVHLWDAALSAGKVVFAAGSDDTHDVFNHETLQKSCTWINAAGTNRNDVIQAMKKGAAYTMTFAEKPVPRREDLPLLTALNLHDNRLTVCFTQKAHIKFHGQHGSILASSNVAATASCFISKSDTYVRITAEFPGGVHILLNPVFRHNNAEPVETAMPMVDIWASTISGAMGIVVLAGWTWMIGAGAIKRALRKKGRMPHRNWGLPSLASRRITRS